VIFYIPFPKEEDAVKAGEYLLKERKIGCYNLFPVKSGYWWQGDICRDNEVVLVAKTLPEMDDAVRETISSIHPYSVPCIASWRVKINEKYYEWMEKEVRKTERV